MNITKKPRFNIYNHECRSADFTMAGTTDGEMDFVFKPRGGRSRTVQLKDHEVSALIVKLKLALIDLEAKAPFYD